MNQLIEFVNTAFSNREVSYKSILIVVIAHQILSKLFSLISIPILEHLPLFEHSVFQNQLYDRYALAFFGLVIVNLPTGFLMSHLCKRFIYQHCLILGAFLFITDSIEIIYSMTFMTYHTLSGYMGFNYSLLNENLIQNFVLAALSLLNIPTILLGGFLYLRTYSEQLEEQNIITEYLDESSLPADNSK